MLRGFVVSKVTSKYEATLRKVRAMTPGGVPLTLKGEDPKGFQARLYQAIHRDEGCRDVAKKAKSRYRISTNSQGIVVALVRR